MKVLITAGQVYGRLDDNKLVGNRIRGVWACKFARYLSELGHTVTLLVPDTMVRPLIMHQLGESKADPLEVGAIHINHHNSFESYRDRCWEAAEDHDAAVMAAAVMNWIPAEPITGKMDTSGYKAGDRIDIPFVLAESVINRMREINPKLHLIGCKMLSGSTEDQLLGAARKVILASKSHVVIANDMQAGLRRKLLVYPDGCVQEFNDDWDALYGGLLAVILDEHWRTEWTPGDNAEIINKGDPHMEKARKIFDTVADLYRDRFTARDGKTVHGAILVPVVGGGYICTPRVKGPEFTSADAVWVAPEFNWWKYGDQAVIVGEGAKASMNLPLLERVSGQKMCQDPMETGSYVVLHLHEMLQGVPTLPYAPPGTVRDNGRKIPSGAFNIEGHGFVARLDYDGTISRE